MFFNNSQICSRILDLGKGSWIFHEQIFFVYHLFRSFLTPTFHLALSRYSSLTRGKHLRNIDMKLTSTPRKLEFYIPGYIFEVIPSSWGTFFTTLDNKEDFSSENSNVQEVRYAYFSDQHKNKINITYKDQTRL